MTEVVIRCECIAPPEQRVKHIRSALSRGLPEVEIAGSRIGVLHIYANGPSARTEEKIWPCMALNGALGLFRDHEAPTYWAACDPQELVSGFVTNAPLCTTYLLSSRCDPSVFDALAGKSVLLWHQVDDFPELKGRDLMPESPSITLTAIYLAVYMGWRKVVVHGWDGCFSGGQSHAVSQGVNGDVIRAAFNGVEYETTDAWLAEMQDAVTVVKSLPMAEITATGNGLIASMVRYANLN